ncbi:MAG: PilT/PilU family type 4a pilus ATPase [Lentisphaerae bacterium]|nr:PilT/PilU family type 4a pilus ATPase [Lentisphaerota bacterium]
MMDKNSVTREIDWLCYHAVQEGLLDPPTCVAVMEALEENKVIPEMQIFLEVVQQNNLCSDYAQLQNLAAMAKEEAKVFAPPYSIFAAEAPEPTAQNEPAAVERPDENAAPAAVKTEALPEINALPPLPDSDADWLNGWPVLAEVENLPLEGQRKLLADFLSRGRQCQCSDIHISTGAYPFVRRFTKIYLLPGQQVLTAKAAEMLNLCRLDDEQRQQFEEEHELDYSLKISDQERYRTNVMKQRLGVAGSYRVIDAAVKSITELGFRNPEVIEKLTAHNQGLVLITGPAGCGKSSTLNTLVDFINRNREDHIITIEDPIEVIHRPIRCNVTQRELGRHTKSFSNALRAALREDPDIIVIGELRDLETIEMAIRAAETGHLVFGTLHTSSAPSTMDRVLDVFPPNQQSQIRSMVAESLKAVICQQLHPNHDDTGVCMSAEILLSTLAVSNLIREGKTYQIHSTIQTSRNIGMSTMEQSMFDLFMDGKRSFEQTLPYIKTPDLVRQMQAREAQNFSQGRHG